MCTTCGCSGEGATIHGPGAGHAHGHDHHAADHRHHAHGHDHDHHHDHHHDHGPASKARLVEVETALLAKNDRFAAENRARLRASGTLALNLVSSPGSGKTTLLAETVRALAGRFRIGVIEGDQQTANDAERIRAAGAPAVQVNTGKGCHLDAHMVGHALDHLPPLDGGVLFIENVGNLVCPAAFDLGERAKVAILSVTEGEDKPLKYPDMFAAATLMIVAKTDIAPHIGVDLDLIEANARRINPGIETLRLSARSGEGMEGWIDWIARARAALAPAAALNGAAAS
jgi:hydrogenase nickel incorporation protein HypB